jgi:hypothetical protein
VSKKLLSKLTGANSLVKYLFFYSADLRTRFARAANFPSRKKSITLLTCCINDYLSMLQDTSKCNPDPIKIMIKITSRTMLFHLAEVFQVQVCEAINSRRNTKSKDIYGLKTNIDKPNCKCVDFTFNKSINCCIKSTTYSRMFKNEFSSINKKKYVISLTLVMFIVSKKIEKVLNQIAE